MDYYVRRPKVTRDSRRNGVADKTNTARGGGAAPTADTPAAIRNVVLVGPSGAGKTTLVEALLVAAGVLPRAGLRRRRQHGLRLRRRRDPAATLGGLGGGAASARRRQGEPDRHPRLRRLRRRAARRIAGRGLRAVRHRRQRWRRRANQDAVARVRPGRHAARRGHHQARPRAGELRQRAGLGAECVRRQGVTALSADRERADRAAVPAALRVFGRQTRYARAGLVIRRSDRGHARRADRGNHRGIRGRVADGALPRRRRDRPGGTDRGLGEGRRARLVLPGDSGVQRYRCRNVGVVGGGDQRVPVATGTSAAGGVHPAGRRT